jgi:hypothetical protein
MPEAQTSGAGTPVQSRFHDPLLSKLDSYRRAQPDPPSRAKAVLQLVERALTESPNQAGAAA